MIAWQQHQKNVICFSKNIYNEMSCHNCCDCQESTDDEAMAAEKPIRLMDPGITQDHKLDALIKEEILRNKEQPATVTEKPIRDGIIINTMAAMTVGIFFGLRTIDAAQYDALLTSTSFVWLMSFLYRRQR